jgi:imidazolonepropionase-like amidohydrolase
VFSPIDLIQIMGPNSAAFIDRSKDIGTLEPGKLADIVILGGNPLDGYWNLLTAKIVIKGGVVMIDKRSKS